MSDVFEMRVKKDDDGGWHWPDKQWLPLAVSLQAPATLAILPRPFAESAKGREFDSNHAWAG